VSLVYFVFDVLPIPDFMEIAIPISQDTSNPLEERIAIIKDFADKVISACFNEGHPTQGIIQIALSAKKDLQPYDTELEALKENL